MNQLASTLWLPDRWPVEWHDQVTSTQDIAFDRVGAGRSGSVWIAAREQTQGRGRHGRLWRSPRGNLYATALFSCSRCIEPPYIGMSAALAVLDAVRALGVSDLPSLKWPNDIVIGDSKLGGVLVETRMCGDRHWASVGFGINVVSAPEVDRPSIALVDLCRWHRPDAETVFKVLVEAFAARAGRYVESGSKVVSASWRAEACRSEQG